MTTEKLCENVFLNIMESIKPERMFGGVKEALDDGKKTHKRRLVSKNQESEKDIV